MVFTSLVCAVCAFGQRFGDREGTVFQLVDSELSQGAGAAVGKAAKGFTTCDSLGSGTVHVQIGADMDKANAASDCPAVEMITIVFGNIEVSHGPKSATFGAFIDHFLMPRFEWVVSIVHPPLLCGGCAN